MSHRPDEVLALLRDRSPLAAVGPDALRALARVMRVVALDDGDRLFAEGDAGDAAYVVLEGAVAILARGGDGGEHERARLGPGAFFGELALFGGGRRAASARAAGRVVVGALGYAAFTEVVRTWPDAALALLQIQTRRFLEVERELRAKLGGPLA